MQYVKETGKSVQQAVDDLRDIMAKHKFDVLHIHDLEATLKEKGVDLSNACQILEICNPQTAKEILMANMELNMTLPSRISVYTENGKTKIGMVRHTSMSQLLSDSTKLVEIIKEAEDNIMAIIDEAA